MRDQVNLSGAANPAPQFSSCAQQREAATLGMWVFLATEVLFFGTLFLAYTVYRTGYPSDFMTASKHTLIWVGTGNTAVLLLSSYAMVRAVQAMVEGDGASSRRHLLVTAGLGLLFLTLKGCEYRIEINEGLFPGASFMLDGGHSPHGQMFFYLYFLMTGVHAVHVLIGVGLISSFAFRLREGGKGPPSHTAVELLGLYWHFVDVVWVFLFPLLYLNGRHG